MMTRDQSGVSAPGPAQPQMKNTWWRPTETTASSPNSDGVLHEYFRPYVYGNSPFHLRPAVPD